MTTARYELSRLLMACAGAFLLLPAWLSADRMPASAAAAISMVDMALWIVAIAGFAYCAIRSGADERAVLRWTLIMAFFALSLFPYNIDQYRIVTLRTAAMIGFTLLIIGLAQSRMTRPLCARVDAAARRARALPAWIFIGALYAAFLCAAVYLSWRCFGFFPIYTDSEAQYIQAKFVADGHLYAPAPKLPGFFYIPMSSIRDGRLFSQYQPLHLFIIALGHLAGAPWMVNPTEGALTLVATYLLTRRISDEASARIAAALTLGCQFMLFMSAEYMNHASALLFSTLFMLCYVETLAALKRSDRSRALPLALAAGLSLGAVFLARPLSAVGMGAPFVFYALYRLWKNPRRHIQAFMLMAAGSLSCLAFDAWYNAQLTGSALEFPYMVYSGGDLASAMGYERSHIWHNFFWRGIKKAADEWTRVNSSLFEWRAPAAIFIMIACLRLKSAYARLVAASVFSYFAVNMFNQWWSSTFGPRYVYETSSALIALAAIGIRRTPLFLRTLRLSSAKAGALRGATVIAVVCLFYPAAAYRLPKNFAMYSHYFDSDPKFYYQLAAQSEKPALIFIERQNKDQKYHSVAHAYPAGDDAPIIFAIDRGDEKDRKLIAQYRYRHIYRELGGILFPMGIGLTAPRFFP